MTPGQVREWLGVQPGDPRQLRPEITAALAPLPVPVTTAGQMATFTVFLRAAAPWPRGERIFAPDTPASTPRSAPGRQGG